ncbi:MAG: 50S ribosomal protein L6 [Candidatus Eisenbacteria bacterium]|nr:50S ribosomal protein L6 [Candidatus Eisenbacteria bacterium]
MSRVGKKPVPIPSGVTVDVAGDTVVVKGPKGELSFRVPVGITVALDGGQVKVTPGSDSLRVKAVHGMTRSVLSNLVTGVTTGFSRALEIVGTGYRAQMDGQKLVLFLGYAKPVEYTAPAGVQLAVESPTKVVVSGIDRVLVGEVAHAIRSFRKPEPYKGKGIRYEGEYVRKKAGKAAVGSASG